MGVGEEANCYADVEEGEGEDGGKGPGEKARVQILRAGADGGLEGGAGGEGVGEGQGDCGVVQGDDEGEASREEHARWGSGEIHCP